MQKTKISQEDYTLNQREYQLKLPIELHYKIAPNDPVRLLNIFVEEINLKELYKTYSRVSEKKASPRQLLKIVLYGAMNKLYSSRDIERACKRDINFMYLLEGKPVPDHSTIARFMNIHLASCSKVLMVEMVRFLKEIGEISAETVFIDGTKIESCANKYTFVWKRAVSKNHKRLLEKILDLIACIEEKYAVNLVYKNKVSIHTLKRVRKKLYKIKREENVVFVYGKGKRKTVIQRDIECLESYLEKLKEYTKHLYICGDRNSYSKTDTDATFMRMKEDAMLNGQLKPAYNLQHCVDAEYVTWVSIFSNPTDVKTLIPLLDEMKEHLDFSYKNIVCDAGYESEENYFYITNNEQIAYIKPSNHEIAKKRKYKSDIGRAENMQYHADEDYYICHNGKRLLAADEKRQKTKRGYERITTIYRSESCMNCEHKSACIKGNNSKKPLAERTKTLYVSKEFQQMRNASSERINSDFGKQLRMNRSIQAEGSFANIKADMNFRRYSRRGNNNVLMESLVVAMAFNINKLHHKIQSKRTGQYLFELKKAG
ncbi:MAG: IS5/IS1182 family transposase [Clostridiales bacterium]|nr:MAG: IS5/IS1182 family transposase [Clostridiales bacterium]